MQVGEILAVYLLRVNKAIKIAFLTSVIYWLYPVNYLAFEFLMWYENQLAKINNYLNKI